MRFSLVISILLFNLLSLFFFFSSRRRHTIFDCDWSSDVCSSDLYYAYSLGVSDVNGDGKPDLVVANQCATNSSCANGIVGVLLGNGDGTFQPALAFSSGGKFAFSVAIADVNGDGKPDLLIANQYASTANQSTGTVAVLLGNGDGTFQPAVTYGSAV